MPERASRKINVCMNSMIEGGDIELFQYKGDQGSFVCTQIVVAILESRHA